MNYAYVYYFNDAAKLSEFLVSYESLMATKPKYPIYCMLGGACINQKFVEFLSSLGVGYLISDMPCSVATRDCQGHRTSVYDCVGKMDIFLFTQFDKIVYLDTDTFICKNIDELFNAPDGSMATHHDEKMANRGGCNAGVLVIKPNIETWNKLYLSLQSGMALNKFQFKDDQAFLSQIYDYENNNSLKLNYMYNLIFKLSNEYIQNPLFDVNSVKIWHMCTPIVQKLEDATSSRCFENRDVKISYTLSDNIFNDYISFYDKVINKYRTIYPYLPLAHTKMYIENVNITLTIALNSDMSGDDSLFAMLSSIASQRLVPFNNLQIFIYGTSYPKKIIENKLFISLPIVYRFMESEERDCKNIIKNCHSDYILFMDNFLFTSPEMLWEIFEEIKKYPFSTLQFNVVNDTFNECSHVNVFPVNKDNNDIKKIDLQLAVKI